MPYTKPRDWADGFDGGTPITAADLNRIEDGITATTVKADAAATATALAAVKTKADAAATATALAAAVPVGVVQMWAGKAAPAGWLLCQGQAVSRTTYAALYAVCGTAYGTGDGSSTFNLPDLRARIPIGLSSTGTFNALGKTGGEEEHTLTIAEMPAHNHEPSFLGASTGTWGITGSNVAMVTGLVDTKNAGGGGAHNNMPPYMVVNFIIRAA